MALIDNLTWKMTLDAVGFNVVAEQAGKVINTLSRNFDGTAAAAMKTEQAIHKVGSSFKSTVVTLGALRFALMDLDDFLLAFPKSIAKAGGEFQRMETLMQGLSKSTDETVAKLEAARDVMAVIGLAKTAPFEVKALTDVFVKLKSAGIDPANGSMQALVNSVAKFGGTSETIKRSSVAIQQMVGKGVISMEELRQQLGEAIPNAIQLMARGMGLSIAELTDKVSKGVVRSETALARMFMQMALDADGAADKMMKTMPGALARMTTEYELFQKTVADQGFLATLTAAFNEITDMLASPAGQEFAKSIGVGLSSVTESLVLMGRWIVDNTDLLKQMGVVLLSVFGGSKLAGAWSGIMGRMADVRAEQQKLVDASNAGTQREINALKTKGEELQRNANKSKIALEQGIVDRQAALGKELAAFNSYKNNVVAGLQEVRNQRRVEATEAIAQLRALEAEQRAMRARAVVSNLIQNNFGSTGKGLIGAVAPAAVGSSNVSALLQSSQQNAAADLTRVAAVNVKALESELVAQKALVAEKLNAVRVAGQSVIAKGAETMTGNANIKALEDELKKNQSLLLQNGQMIAGKTMLANATTSAGTALLGFGKTLLAGAGWGIAFSLALEGIMWLFDQFTKKARTAEAAQQAFNRAKESKSTEGDAERIEKGLKQKRGQLADLEKELKTATEYASRGRNAQLGLPEVARLKAEIAKLKTGIEEYTQEQADAIVNIAANATLKKSGDLLAKIQANTVAAISKDPIINEQKQINKDLGAATEAKNKPEVIELTKDSEFLGKKRAQLELKLYTEASAKMVAGMKGVDAATRAQVEQGVAEHIAALSKNVALVSDVDVLTKPKKEPKAFVRPDSPYDNFLQAKTKDLVAIQANAAIFEDGIITVAEVYQAAQKRLESAMNPKQPGGATMFDTDAKGKKRPLSDEQQVDYIVADGDADIAKRVEKMRAKLVPELEKLQKDEERYADVFNGGALFKPSADSVSAGKALAEIEKMRTLLGPGFSATVNGITVSLDEMISRLARAGTMGLGNITNDLNKQASALEDDLITDERERDRIKTALRIKAAEDRLAIEIKTLRAIGTLNDADLADQNVKIAAAKKALGLVVDRENQALAIRTASASVKMAAEWANGMRAMEGFTANFMSSLVDKLVDGETHFRQFAKDAIKEIAKITIKQNLSGVTGGAGDGISGFLGSILGLKSGASSTPGFDSANNAQRVINVGGTGGVDQKPLEQGWQEIKDGYAKVVTWAETMFESAGKYMGDIFTSLGNGLAQMLQALQASASGGSGGDGGFWGALIKGVGAYFGVSTSDSSGAGTASDSIGGGTANQNNFANGGIMTSAGALSLKKYANGGIANKPQLALFGEGSRPEAYVPLPDGRSIPVSLSGGGSAPESGASGEAPSVTINLINQSGTQQTAATGNIKFDGRQMVLDVVLSAASQPGPFRDNLRTVVNQK